MVRRGAAIAKNIAGNCVPSARIRADAVRPYPADTTTILLNLVRKFDGRQKPIEVSFRELVPWLKVGERATHYLHTYPAKLLPQICHFFFAAKGWLPQNALILDPFCGTGTVPLEANLSGRSALYADANPLARLITRAKTSLFNPDRLDETFLAIKEAFDSAEGGALPWVVNIDHWYSANAKLDLAKLRATILRHAPDDLADFFWATFSATARKSSRASPRFAVPVLDKLVPTPSRSRDVWTIFSDQYQANLARHRQLQAWSDGGTTAACVGTDARKLEAVTARGLSKGRLRANSVDLILTSPPYAGAQKYVRASSLNLGWLGMTGPKTLKELESASIGREHFPTAELDQPLSTGLDTADRLMARLQKKNALRAKICSTYLIEMKAALEECVRVLKQNGHAIIIIGDNTVCGEPFPSSLYLEEYLRNMGLTLELKLVDKIKSRGLLMKRQGGAAAIKSETILVFKK